MQIQENRKQENSASLINVWMPFGNIWWQQCPSTIYEWMMQMLLEQTHYPSERLSIEKKPHFWCNPVLLQFQILARVQRETLDSSFIALSPRSENTAFLGSKGFAAFAEMGKKAQSWTDKLEQTYRGECPITIPDPISWPFLQGLQSTQSLGLLE